MEVSAGGGSIVVSGVSHNFSTTHNRNLVLDDVTVSMQPGVMTLLHGVSGSGKTTLLNIMSGLLKPASGTVFVEGSDIYSLSTSERDDIRLNRIGMIFQEHSLIVDFTVRENVELILRVVDSALVPALWRSRLSNGLGSPTSRIAILDSYPVVKPNGSG